jgi:O-antigen/teichoic acid export membrane protein
LIFALAGPTEAMNIAAGRTKFVAGYALVGALASFILNLLLIPELGIEGAGLVAIFSILLMKIIALSKLKTKDKIALFKPQYVNFIIFSILIGLALGFSIEKFISSNLLGVILFAVLFFAFEILILKKFNLIDEKDRLLKNLIVLKFSSFYGK